MPALDASIVLAASLVLRASALKTSVGVVPIILRNCRFFAASAGLVSFVVGSVVPGFVLPVTAGALDLGYNYIAFFGEQWESGDGHYTTGASTLTRETVLASSNNGDFVNFSSPPTVIMSQATEVLIPPTPGRLLKSTLFTGSTTWNKDANANSILAFAIAGGGGGGGGIDIGNGSNAGGGGGGGGACSISLIELLAVTSYSITIGAAGSAGSAGGNGGAGGDTIIGSNIVVAKGGSPGLVGTTAPNSNAGLGGVGSNGTGQIKLSGNGGGVGWSVDVSLSIDGFGGHGGGSALFGGGGPMNAAGSNYGGGGGGAPASPVAGKAGFTGAVWILEFT